MITLNIGATSVNILGVGYSPPYKTNNFKYHIQGLYLISLYPITLKGTFNVMANAG